jgi:hypothetical protein
MKSSTLFKILCLRRYYEECRLLGYKNPFRTSQETHLRYRAQSVNAMSDFEVFKAVTMKNAVFLGVTLCGSCKNRGLEEMYRLHYQREKNG